MTHLMSSNGFCHAVQTAKKNPVTRRVSKKTS